MDVYVLERIVQLEIWNLNVYVYETWVLMVELDIWELNKFCMNEVFVVMDWWKKCLMNIT